MEAENFKHHKRRLYMVRYMANVFLILHARQRINSKKVGTL